MHFRLAPTFAAAILFVSLLALCSGCANNEPTEQPYKIVHKYGVSDPEFNQTMANLLGPPLTGGNRVTTLVNGDQIFPPMLDAIRGRNRRLTLKPTCIGPARLAASFPRRCASRRNGVEVRVIIDTFGSMKIDQNYVKEMTDSGVKLVKYHPLRWHEFGPSSKINNRTHRKLLIVDGRLGFTGGVGIADEWLGNADRSPIGATTTTCRRTGRLAVSGVVCG